MAVPIPGRSPGRSPGAGGLGDRPVRPRRPRHGHGPDRPGADRGDRRHRGDRVLQGFRPQRAAARRRGGAGRARRRRAAPVRRGRPGDLHHGQQRRDRGRARARHTRAHLLQPDRLRRRRRVRDRAPGGDGDRDRGRPRGGLLPGAERALRPPLRPRRRGRGRRADDLRHRQRLALPDGHRHARRDRRHARPALHALLRRDQRGLRPGDGRRPPPRRDQPAGLVLPAPGHARRAPGLAVDRRTPPAARLLPGERRRRGRRGHQRWTGPATCRTGPR